VIVSIVSCGPTYTGRNSAFATQETVSSAARDAVLPNNPEDSIKSAIGLHDLLSSPKHRAEKDGTPPSGDPILRYRNSGYQKWMT
jgi:hypothetical protein